jgi:hypothetical protein
MFKIRSFDWRVVVATVTLGATALLAACGGGGDASPDAAAPTEVAADYTQGVITGFGSVIVGGVRYDDANALVSDDDDNRRDRSLLKLGMVVQVDGSAVDRALGTARALRIRFGSEVLGPVGTIDTAAATVEVLGQTVLVTTSTVFDESLAGGLAAITTGDVLEVHGILDPANSRIVATRIELEDSALAYRLRGVISALDTTAKTFRIGDELISYSGLLSADILPSLLVNGQVVRVLLQTTQVNGAWVATRLVPGVRLIDGSLPDAHVEGVITSFTSTSQFAVNGLAVDASNAAFPDGRDAIALGARVEVTGTVTDGVLVATKVEVEDRRDNGRRALELHGALSNLDTAAKTFALRGVTVWYGGTVLWKDGTEASLANGQSIEAKGVLSADRTRLEALLIDFE